MVRCAAKFITYSYLWYFLENLSLACLLNALHNHARKSLFSKYPELSSRTNHRYMAYGE
jgi:hypothetical protein